MYLCRLELDNLFRTYSEQGINNIFYEPGRSFPIKLQWRRTLVHFITKDQNANSQIYSLPRINI